MRPGCCMALEPPPPPHPARKTATSPSAIGTCFIARSVRLAYETGVSVYCGAFHGKFMKRDTRYGRAM
jgi:hypothetical protein